MQIRDLRNDTLLLDYPSEIVNEKITSKFLTSLKEFNVARYIDSDTVKKSNEDSAITWNYKLSFKVALPGDIEDKLEERIYYLSDRSTGNLQLGSTANQNLVFELSQNLIQLLHPFIDSFELTPESMNEEVADPTNVEKIPKINLPK